MKRSFLLPLAALVLCAVVLLAVTFGLNGVAASNAQRSHLELMHTLLPGSETFSVQPYTGEDANIRSVHKAENGYVIETVTNGYASEITMLIGVSNAGKVTGLMVRQAHETAGLGNTVLTDTDFLAQFLNASGEFSVTTQSADSISSATETATDGSGLEVDAITGATVTSKAIARSVNSACGYVTGADIVSSATTWGE